MSSFRRRLMMAQGGGSAEGIPSTEAVAGDVCMYGINEGKLIIVNDWDASKYPIDKYPPIGVVVVPGSHGHYEGGKCAVMSLNHMNCTTPQQGGATQGMYWGVGTDIELLPNLNMVPYVGNDGNIGEDVIGQTTGLNIAFLPSDHPQFNKVDNPYDTKTKYYNNKKYYIPSPYNNDGTLNTEYSRITSPSSTANCLSDFDGYNNTKKIIEVRGSKIYLTWKPTYNNGSDYPAASCCDMYSTVGTNQGEWYLPSAGELGYVVVRQQTINNAIDKLISAGVTNVNTVQLFNYYSSSEYSKTASCLIDFYSGNISGYSKDLPNPYVRAFCLV